RKSTPIEIPAHVRREMVALGLLVVAALFVVGLMTWLGGSGDNVGGWVRGGADPACSRKPSGASFYGPVFGAGVVASNPCRPDALAARPDGLRPPLHERTGCRRRRAGWRLYRPGPLHLPL